MITHGVGARAAFFWIFLLLLSHGLAVDLECRNPEVELEAWDRTCYSKCYDNIIMPGTYRSDVCKYMTNIEGSPEDWTEVLTDGYSPFVDTPSTNPLDTCHSYSYKFPFTTSEENEDKFYFWCNACIEGYKGEAGQFRHGEYVSGQAS